jgi:tRNA-uridine 2-sulfurtransferase
MSDVVVGLSGGVDSAVAALLLLEQGHSVRAVFMKNWDEDDAEGYCPAEQDLEDARAIAAQLGIALRTVSFSAEYWDRVFEFFLAECAAGRTPSPDIVCNREIKFRAFLDYADGLGAEYIATGHYARLDRQHGIHLLRGIDLAKDQTYFLHTLDQAQLARSLFPLGGLYKHEVRCIASHAGFANHAKKDSTGICFIGERRFSKFLSRYLVKRPGTIRSLDDTVLGTQDGVAFYTIGQRQGLGIGGRSDSTGEAWYVAGKDIAHNILYVVQGGNHPALFAPALYASRLHWIAGPAPTEALRCRARIRHQQELQECTLRPELNGMCTVNFDQPQRAVAPGQSVVFYQGEECLGGAVIEQALQPDERR